MTFSKRLAQEYAEDGFVTAVEVFPEDEIREYRRAFDALEAREGKERCQIGIMGRHFEEEFIWRMATQRRLLDLMEALVGEDLVLLSTHFFCKYPDKEATKFVAWHQDVTYWGLEPPTAHTAWIAIDDADEENGCMLVLPGSHKRGIVQHGTSARSGNLLSINQEIPAAEIDERQAVCLPLKAGQASVHDGQLFHASRPNRSTRRRCGMTVRFIPPNARQVSPNSVGEPWRPILVRGRDRYGYHGTVEPPFLLS